MSSLIRKNELKKGRGDIYFHSGSDSQIENGPTGACVYSNFNASEEYFRNDCIEEYGNRHRTIGINKEKHSRFDNWDFKNVKF